MQVSYEQFLEGVQDAHVFEQVVRQLLEFVQDFLLAIPAQPEIIKLLYDVLLIVRL